MGYMALYRSWRPETFEDVAGQRHVTQTLRNAVQLGRTTHAYLFCGPRGTGKTTVARILAKALNCAKGPTPNPCNSCQICLSISAGFAPDVLEIDAASNRGIDEVRDLREKTRFVPVEARYKVYIVDEVHMLTTEAFNALLKTLEEPPAHVVFILATTEPHRLPPTIPSRCQRFDFHRLPLEEIAGYLRKVCRQLGVEVAEGALSFMARAADGSMRDALTLLDQCLAYKGGGVSREDVEGLLGMAGDEACFAVDAGLGSGDVSAVLRVVHEVANAGKDIRQFTRELVQHFRDLLLVKTCPDPGGLIDCSPDRLSRLGARAAGWEAQSLLKAIRTLGVAESSMRWAPQPRLWLEVALIDFLQEARGAEAPAGVAAGKMEQAAAGIVRGPAARGDLDIERVREAWPGLLAHIKKLARPTHALLVEGELVDAAGSVVTVSFRPGYAFHKENVEKQEHRELVEKTLARLLRTQVRLKCVLGDEKPGAADVARLPPRIDGRPQHPAVRDAVEVFEGEEVDTGDPGGGG